MKRRIISILLALCLALTLLPVAAFATEDGVDSAPAAAGVSGGEAAGNGSTEQPRQQETQQPEETPEQPEEQPEAKPAEQPEEPQLEAEGENTPVLLNEGSTTTVTTEAELTAALAGTAETIQLAANIDISSALTVTRTVTLDLNGKVLRMTGNDTVIDVKKGNPFGIGYLTLTDSDSAAVHKFTPNEDGLWVLDETNGTKTVNGGVITGGKYMGIFVEGYGTQNPTQKPDEAACAHLIMKGGNIVGCMTERNGGGVCAVRHAYFTMTGGSIRGCVAKNSGGGVSLSMASVFDMSGSALIADCVSTGSTNSAGGGIGAYGSSVTLSGNAAIQNCTAELGGGVNLDTTDLTMSGNASITGCTATNGGGGVHTQGNIRGNTVVFTMKDASSIVNCTALKGGGVFFMTNSGVMSLAGNAKIENCRAIEREGLSTPDAFGGDVHVVIGRLEISGGSITGCTAAKGGDSVYTEVSGGFTMTGGSVDGSIRLTYKNGNNTVYMDGLGTEAYPYEIGTADQLKLFRDIVNGANGQTQNPAACAKLMADIDLKNMEWEPIGYASDYDETKAYSGTFDGQGHTISGLYADAAVSGLFGYTKDAAIKNLTVAGSVGGGSCSTAGGGIVGYAVGGAIENCGDLCEVKVRSARPGGGIVGFASDLTITGCYNAGKVFKPDGCSGGGIVGKGENVKIYDCYNVGEVEGYTGQRGGIVGEASGSVFVYNCYNTGNIIEASTGDANKTVCGIVGGGFGDDPVEITIQNCYYLEGTRADAKAAAKPAKDFADGTVLAALKAGTHNGTNDPWDSQCKYLDGKTLPVLGWQNLSAHTHTWTAWTHVEGTETHTHSCTCGAVETVNCSGGTPTCTEKAKCTTCGHEYGKALNHDFTIQQHDNDEHWKKCSRCDEITDKDPHDWDSGKVTTPATCTTHGEKTFTCSVCGRTKTEQIAASGHSWKSEWTSDATHHWHECANDYCDVKDDNTKKDGYAQHTGGEATCTAKAVCEVCNAAYGETNSANHDWNAWKSNGDDTHTRVCKRDEKHTETVSCSGGTATCTAKAKCITCGGEYGSTAPNNHDGKLKHEPAKAATKYAEGNIEYWHCPDCGKYYKDANATQEIEKKDTITPRITSTGGGFPTSGKKDDTKKDDAKTVKSGQTGDPGVALYAATALLSLTGGAWIVGKKRK